MRDSRSLYFGAADLNDVRQGHVNITHPWGDAPRPDKFQRTWHGCLKPGDTPLLQCRYEAPNSASEWTLDDHISCVGSNFAIGSAAARRGGVWSCAARTLPGSVGPLIALKLAIDEQR
ncbi:hypothetical protein BDV93DRAFT_95925 [Ceratobasidium sp. AG-I]|nr:hypothetical protein BDV93DRAFT_95925 [Ceratobasidium sp. AG-I]